jgi:hypothetical protein
MAGHEQDFDIQDSSPNAAVTDDGVRDTGPVDEPDVVPPEQRPGAVEENPAGMGPTAGYPRLDPRADERPYETP